MKNVTQHTGKLEILSRLPSSRNGNPRYLARIDGYTFRTAPDSSIAYSLPNWDGKIARCYLGTYRGLLTIDSIHKA